MRLWGFALGLGLLVPLLRAAEDPTPPGWYRRSDAEVGVVTYGNGTFVASGYGGVLVSSTNGINWTTCDSGTTNELVSPIYAGHQFLCVGIAGTVVTSTDGRHWTRRPPPTTRSLMSAAYGNGVTIAVGGDSLGGVESQVMLRSTNDGTDWEVVRQGTGQPFHRVAYGADRFAVFHAAMNKVLVSKDGSTWQTNDFPYSSPVSLFYAGTNFFALGIAPDPDGTRFPHIWTSAEASEWEDAKIPVPKSGIGCVAYGAGAYIATGSIQGESHYDWIRGTITWDPDTPLVLSSQDGRSWRRETAPSPILYSLAYGHQTFVAVARVSTNAGRIYQTDPVVPRLGRQPRVTNGRFESDVISDPGIGFRVQRSEDFKAWIDVTEAVDPPERTAFTDFIGTPPTTNHFYRVSPLGRP